MRTYENRDLLARLQIIKFEDVFSCLGKFKYVKESLKIMKTSKGLATDAK